MLLPVESAPAGAHRARVLSRRARAPHSRRTLLDFFGRPATGGGCIEIHGKTPLIEPYVRISRIRLSDGADSPPPGCTETATISRYSVYQYEFNYISDRSPGLEIGAPQCNPLPAAPIKLVLGVFEFSWLLDQQHLISTGIHDAARYLARSASPNDVTIQRDAKTLATNGGDGRERPQGQGLDDARYQYYLRLYR